MDEGDRIAAVEEVPDDGTLLFTIRSGFDEEEAILVKEGGSDRVHAWKNFCQHWTDVPLDSGSGAPVRDGELVCQKHGAMFETDSGICTFGPCEGASLESVAVTVENGAVYLAESEYEYGSRGRSATRDRSTRGGLDF